MRLPGQRTVSDEWDWRRVPQISLVATGSERKWSPVTLVFGVLVVAIVLWGFVAYSGLMSERDRRDSRLSALAAAEAQLAGLDDEVAGLFQQIEGLTTRRDELTAGGVEPIAGEAIKWEAAMAVVLGLDNEAVQVGTVLANPSGAITVGGTTRDVGSMGELQALLSQASDIVELVAFQWTDSEGVIAYTASLRVLR